MSNTLPNPRARTLPVDMLALIVLLCSAARATAQQQVDVLIRGGSMIDGTGAAARQADVGITGDRITFLGDAGKNRVTGARTIDAKGLIVSPGFIDPHTHTAGDLARRARSAR
jgi:N-acyl-D-aspartate/D-glutamate deacylase